MNRTQHGKNGRLILVGTPIGNLQDLSPRALKALADADVLLCEDTRRTGILLQGLRITRSGPVESYHDHSAPKMRDRIRDWLGEGKTLAYVTDAGMPGVSDPGYVLVQIAREEGAAVSVIPGPSAVTAFFAASALPSPKFLFHGFFPRTRGEIEKVIQDVRSLPVAHVFYESPHRLLDTLDLVKRNLPKAAVSLGRELTKMHEEFLWGTAEEILGDMGEREEGVKGECVLGIMGGDEGEVVAVESQSQSHSPHETAATSPAPWEPDAPAQELTIDAHKHQELVTALKSGMASKEVAKAFSKKWGISRRALYDYLVKRLT